MLLVEDGKIQIIERKLWLAPLTLLYLRLRDRLLLDVGLGIAETTGWNQSQGTHNYLLEAI
jgi:hypothetical protein